MAGFFVLADDSSSRSRHRLYIFRPFLRGKKVQPEAANKHEFMPVAAAGCFRTSMIEPIRLTRCTTCLEIFPPSLAEEHQSCERMLHISTGFLLHFGDAPSNQGLKARAWDLLWREAVHQGRGRHGNNACSTSNCQSMPIFIHREEERK